MPPKRVKKTVASIKLARELESSVLEQLEQVENNFETIAERFRTEELEKIVSMIPEHVRQMNHLDFLNGPPVELFPKVKEEVNHPEEKEEQGEEPEEDDVARDVSIPQLDAPAHNTTEPRLDILSPSGHTISVPTIIHPKIESLKNPRMPRVGEEIAFSINGSPLVLRK